MATTIGLFGAGHLGKIHLRLLKDIPEFQLVGFYDSDPQVAAAVEQEFGVRAFDDPEALLDAVEAVDIVTPTVSHFDLAEWALKKSKHVFVEKPLASTVEEARRLVALQKEANVVGQVGHVERFNPVMLAVQDIKLQPMFIETHRLAQWNPRGTDVSVVLDLMIHDIDIALHLVKANVKRVSASGVAVVSETPDIANARIEFHNGAVANLTASRISLKNMRKTRMFQPNMYLALDFLDKKVEQFSILDQEPTDAPALSFELHDRKRFLQMQAPAVPENINAIQEELRAFSRSIHHRTPPAVGFYEAFLALDVAHQVMEKIQPLG